MPRIPLELGRRSNRSRHDQEGGSRFINCMVEELGEEGKIPFPIYATEGLRSFATTTGSLGCRGLYTRTDGTMLATMGRAVYSVDQSGSATLIGGIPSDGPVYAAENRKTPGRQTVLTSGGLSYVAVGASLTQITDSDLLPAHSCGFVDGYALFGHDDGRFSWSSLDEATSIDALDFATAEGSPDGMLRLLTRRREVWLMGSKSVEIYGPTGNADSAFERLPGAYIERGCLAGASAVSTDDLMVWVADDGTVRAAQGYEGVRISTHEIDRAISDEPDKSAIVAWTYSNRGHTYYVVSGTAFSYAFDFTTKQWHQRQSYGLNRWRAQWHAKLGSKLIVGDYASDKLYELAHDAYDEAGTALVMTVEAPILHKYPQELRLNEIAFDVVAGQGVNSTDPHVGQPEIMLQLSHDGGKTWAPTRRREVGRLGEFGKRVRFHRNGTSNEDGFKFRISASAGVVRGISGASVDIEALR